MRDKLISEFEWLKAQPAGRATSPMMSQFRMFPQPQGTMLRAVPSEEVLIKYVEIYLEMGEATIKQWVKVGRCSVNVLILMVLKCSQVRTCGESKFTGWQNLTG